jgi:tRNA pseudouridine-54 N-methylase
MSRVVQATVKALLYGQDGNAAHLRAELDEGKAKKAQLMEEYEAALQAEVAEAREAKLTPAQKAARAERMAARAAQRAERTAANRCA